MTRNAHFLGVHIDVAFDKAPSFPRRPSCPDRFIWGDHSFTVTSIESEWTDFGRRGRMASNMRPEHAHRAARTGSFGVGRFYFRVRTSEDRVFDLYYDRAPVAGRSGGQWTLFQEWKAFVDASE